MLPAGPGEPGKPISPLVPGKPGEPGGPGRPGSPFVPLKVERGKVEIVSVQRQLSQQTTNQTDSYSALGVTHLVTLEVQLDQEHHNQEVLE